MKGFVHVVVLTMAASGAMAQSAYKCVGTDGSVSFSFTPCPSTQGMSEKVMDSVTTARPDLSSGTEQEQVAAVLKWGFNSYPFLNSEHPAANPQAISRVLAVRDELMLQGYTEPEALYAAVEHVGEDFAPQSGLAQLQQDAREREQYAPKSRGRAVLLNEVDPLPTSKVERELAGSGAARARAMEASSGESIRSPRLEDRGERCIRENEVQQLIVNAAMRSGRAHPGDALQTLGRQTFPGSKLRETPTITTMKYRVGGSNAEAGFVDGCAGNIQVDGMLVNL